MYAVHVEIAAVAIAADTEEHAKELARAMTVSALSEIGDLDIQADAVPEDRDGALADRHWDRVKDARG
jgi:hypothetical protein